MNCENCVFAITNDKSVQHGCRANRIEQINQTSFKNKGFLIERSTTGFFELKKFCNLYRDEKWLKLNKSEDTTELLHNARMEILPSFGIVINDSQIRSIDELNHTVQSLLSIEYPHDKLKIIISTLTNRNVTDIVKLVNELKQKFIHAEAIIHNHNITRVRDTECFKKLVSCHYFVKTKSGAAFRPDIFTIVDSLINDQLKSICMFETQDISIVLKKLMIEHYLSCESYDATIDFVRTLCIDKGYYFKYETF